MQEIKKSVEPLLLSRQEVCDLLGCGLVTLYRKKDDPNFPKPFKLTKKKVVYSYAQIKHWVEEQSTLNKDMPVFSNQLDSEV